MLKEVGASALKDFIGFLKKEPNFFSLDEKSKKELFKKSFSEVYPDVFQHYFMKVEGDTFMRDMRQALDAFEKAAYVDPKNLFFDAMARYITEDFAQAFDQLNRSFFFESLPERLKTLNRILSGQSVLHQTLRDLLFGSTYQEVGVMANEALSYLKEAPTILIQSPMELASDFKEKIRSYILSQYPFSFPEFQVNSDIVGGLRVFVGGKVIDHSWIGKIHSITRLGTFKKN